VLTTVLVTCAAALFESTPFILAGACLAHALRQSVWAVPYLGCGCGSGPSARSLPAAAAALAVFGPFVAVTRLLAAAACSRIAHKEAACSAARPSALHELELVLPAAAAAACVLPLWSALLGAHLGGRAGFIAGAAAAFVTAPCGIGTVALAAALRHAAPAAAAGFLCVAGICDLRTWSTAHRIPRADRDVLAYVLAAAACANAGAHRGAGLVHPAFAVPLLVCAAVFAVCAYRYRDCRAQRARIAPAIMLAGSILAAPMPEYHATETTLAGAFPGERVDFTGVLTRTGSAATLVRYAIVCCRADASPIVVRLSAAPPHLLHGWVQARGTLVQDGSNLLLRADRLRAIAAPADPFVYR